MNPVDSHTAQLRGDAQVALVALVGGVTRVVDRGELFISCAGGAVAFLDDRRNDDKSFTDNDPRRYRPHGVHIGRKLNRSRLGRSAFDGEGWMASQQQSLWEESKATASFRKDLFRASSSKKTGERRLKFCQLLRSLFIAWHLCNQR